MYIVSVTKLGANFSNDPSTPTPQWTKFPATHHHVLKLGIELLKLGGEFLPEKKKKTQKISFST